MSWTRRADCRLCGGPLDLVLDYGEVALANALRASPDLPEPRTPLRLCRCAACGLVQVPEVVDPRLLFGEYRYATGTSRTMADHLAALAAALAAEHPGARVLELASNDGTLLAALARQGLHPLGIEPARALATHARDRGLPTRAAFFDADLARTLRQEEGLFDVVVATNLLAHVDDPVGLLRGAASLLARGGEVVVEVPSLAAMLAQGAFDTVYHEHLCVFSRQSLLDLFARAGLGVRRFEELAVHGGSLRVHAAPGPHAAQALALARAEAPLCSAQALAGLAEGAHAARRALRAQLDLLRGRGLRVAAYGASAKGAVLVQWCGITDLPWVADANPRKVGLFLPGTATPIVDPAHIASDPPDVLLLLAWNLADEIRTLLGGRVPHLLLPLPHPRLIPG